MSSFKISQVTEYETKPKNKSKKRERCEPEGTSKRYDKSKEENVSRKAHHSSNYQRKSTEESVKRKYNNSTKNNYNKNTENEGLKEPDNRTIAEKSFHRQSDIGNTTKSSKSLSERVKDVLDYYSSTTVAPYNRKIKSSLYKEREPTLKFYPRVPSRTVLISYMKPNYRAYDTPSPGPGLTLYRDRLLAFICNINHQSRSSAKIHSHSSYKNKEAKCSSIEEFFYVFPPQKVCPEDKPKEHRLSFIDDPPYQTLKCPKDALDYCRFALPNWVRMNEKSI